MFRRLGLINTNQRGFTMIEVIMALAVTAIITGGITMTIFQVFDGNTRSSNHMIAVRQVQNAGYWISHDTQMAQSVALTAGPDGFPLTLTWADWDSGDVHKVVYTLLADNKLQREHYTNLNPDATTFVAEYIDPTGTSCQFAGGKLTFTVTATVGTQSETRTYEVVPRPDS